MSILKVVTLNLWGEQPPLDRRMQLAVEGLRVLAPDVVGLQEVRQVPGAVPNQAETLARALGMHHYFEPATPWAGGDEGLAILSRHPIVARRVHELPHAVPTERRLVLGVTVESPEGLLDVWTTHLNYRLTDGGKREDQIVALDEHIAASTSKLPKILCGDFNATPDSDEIRFLRGLHTSAGRRTFWQDAWERRHGRADGHTWARANPYTARMRWLERDRRIDYIFVSPLKLDGRGVVHDCRIVLDHAAADGALPSDHFALYAEVQLSPLDEEPRS
ncbi:MAG TPA: endonuclease/exonuclease/phosphatase family protein [Polyangia bacterium]|jgi:endonuclease/exonuclease/phosphatase family metal-dependent hydrolase|nr:endonuclease/exonuclease/phosphatase family protein [Polyangia bacterium]